MNKFFRIQTLVSIPVALAIAIIVQYLFNDEESFDTSYLFYGLVAKGTSSVLLYTCFICIYESTLAGLEKKLNREFSFSYYFGWNLILITIVVGLNVAFDYIDNKNWLVSRWPSYLLDFLTFVIFNIVYNLLRLLLRMRFIK